MTIMTFDNVDWTLVHPAFSVFIEWQRRQFMIDDEAEKRSLEVGEKRRQQHRNKQWNAWLMELNELPFNLKEERYPDACQYARERDVSFAEAMGILKGYDDTYTAHCMKQWHEKRKERRVEKRIARNQQICARLEREVPNFKVKYYRHPDFLKPRNEVFGLDAVRNKLEKHVEKGIRGPYLFYGPPKCGKHTVINMVAHESKRSVYCCPTVSVENREAFRRRMKEIKDIFRHAFEDEGSIFLIDRVDRLLSGMSRKECREVANLFDKIVTVGKGRVVIIATTSHPWNIDPRILVQFQIRLRVGVLEETSNQCVGYDTGINVEIVDEARKTVSKADSCSTQILPKHHMQAAVNSSYSSISDTYMKMLEEWHLLQSDYLVLDELNRRWKFQNEGRKKDKLGLPQKRRELQTIRRMIHKLVCDPYGRTHPEICDELDWFCCRPCKCRSYLEQVESTL